MSGSYVLKEAAAWLVALTTAVVLISLTGYSTRDPDSSLHVAIATRMAKEPMARWIAPEWWGNWRAAGLYREHPAGIFWLPALLARLGYPPQQAAYAVNTLYQALTIILIHRLAALFVPGLEARTLAWLLQLIPIAFTYRIRANHEQVVLLCFLAALYGIERARTRAAWGLLTVFGFAGLMCVKGIFAVFVPIACAALLLLDLRGQGMRRAWAMLAASLAFALVVAGAYEYAYRSVTGEGFVAFYLGKQIGVASAPHSTAIVLQKLHNLIWYVARVMWFAFPWSLVVVVASFRVRARASQAGAPLNVDDGRGRHAAYVCLGISVLYVLAFSLSDRKADRYIFPAYFLVGAVGAALALRRCAPLRRLAESLDARQPWTTVAVFLVLIGLHLLGGWLHLPRIKFWPSD